jgi:hemoglobin-like flavoprotein
VNLSESVHQVLNASDVFGDLFYEEFFRRCPEARPYFAHADMKRQALIVTMTLTTVQQYHDGGYPAVENYLKHLGVLHERKSVPMDTYPHWRAAMLHTLARMHGPEWTRKLNAEWSAALDGALRVMLHGIEERGKAKD